MNAIPHSMEDHFTPGLRTKPAVHVGSQSMRLYHRDPSEQAYEGLHLASAGEKDIIVMRNTDPSYLEYWNSLMGETSIINITGVDEGEYLSNILLDSQDLIDTIKNKMQPESKLMVYLPTDLEQKLANKLGIPLHGSPVVTEKYGTKSGIRTLAKEFHIPMPPGYICSIYNEVLNAINDLKRKFDIIVIKHDLSSAGRWMKKLNMKETNDFKACLDEVAGGKFVEGKDIVVVEAWLKNNASLCAHIEIVEGEDPIIKAGWQQVLDKDGISYIGAGPLMLSQKALDSFKNEVWKLAYALKEKGAIGSYGPDFIVSSEKQENIEPETCVLVELNARVPVTSFPLEIVQQVKGKIGTGFFVIEIKLKEPTSVSNILELLKKHKLLITKKGLDASGVVPYNMNLLRWRHFYLVAIAPSWDEVFPIVEKVKNIFKEGNS